MSKFTPTRAPETQFTPQQPIRLERGLYGAMFRSYSEPKPFPKYQSSETEDKLALRFLVTHSSNEKALPKFSSASLFTTMKWFYDPVGRKQSRYFEFHSAILAGKMTAEEVYDLFDPSRNIDKLPDLDDLIGYPVQLMIESATRADKNGIIHNNISAILPASAGMRKAVAVIYKTADLTYDDSGNFRYMKSPKPEYEEVVAATNGDGQQAAKNGETVAPITDDDFSDIPF